MATEQATEQVLKEAVESGATVLVDFWAPWCAPCKAFGPIYEKVSKGHSEENIRFLKVNTEEEQMLAAAFGIRSIPTLMLFREQVLLFSQPGLLPEAALEDLIDQASKLDMDEVRKKIEEQEQGQAN